MSLRIRSHGRPEPESCDTVGKGKMGMDAHFATLCPVTLHLSQAEWQKYLGNEPYQKTCTGKENRGQTTFFQSQK